MKKWLRLLGVAFFVGTHVQGAALPGTEARQWPVNADKHIVTLTRNAGNDAEAKMIAQAELAAPDASSWWVTKDDGKPLLKGELKVPYAITRDALLYYEAKIKDYQKGSFLAYAEPSSGLTYKAEVKRHAEFVLTGNTYRDVYVVKMHMHVSAQFVADPAMGLHIDKKRVVVLNASGKVLAIDGDSEVWGAQLAL